jgi:hypothetical protein
VTATLTQPARVDTSSGRRLTTAINVGAIPRRSIALPPDMPPTLCVVIDTEEEFDWSAPFTRQATGVRHLRGVDRLQQIFDRHGVRPTYVVDYPVVSQEDGYAPLRAIADDGRCAIGAHLHPWVTPPFDEAVTRSNSFACNLGEALERSKLQRLKSAIEEHFEIEPRVYKAGRYGFGPSTAKIVEHLGFTVDQSVMPHEDFHLEGGPSFDGFDEQPFVFGHERDILELPCTSAYIGAAGAASPRLRELASSPAMRWAHLTGVCARLRLADKLMLSPEGYSCGELRRLTQSLLSRGRRVFALTFHSPSIEAGHTPYVRTSGDVDAFLATIESYLEFFFGSLRGSAATPEELRTTILRSGENAAAQRCQ